MKLSSQIETGPCCRAAVPWPAKASSMSPGAAGGPPTIVLSATTSSSPTKRRRPPPPPPPLRRPSDVKVAAADLGDDVTLRDSGLKLAFHDADTDFLARILILADNTSDTRAIKVIPVAS